MIHANDECEYSSSGRRHPCHHEQRPSLLHQPPFLPFPAPQALSCDARASQQRLSDLWANIASKSMPPSKGWSERCFADPDSMYVERSYEKAMDEMRAAYKLSGLGSAKKLST